MAKRDLTHNRKELIGIFSVPTVPEEDIEINAASLVRKRVKISRQCPLERDLEKRFLLDREKSHFY